MLSSPNRRSRPGRRTTPTRRALITAVLSAMVIMASGAAVACSDTPVGPEPTGDILSVRAGQQLGPLTARNVGTYHNDFLDFAFPRMLDAVARGADRHHVCKVIAQAMRDFVIARRIKADPRSIRDDIAGGGCGGAQAGDPKSGPRLSLAGDGTPIPELDAVVSEMSYAVESGQSLGDLATLFEQKVAYARANFPEAEAELVAAAASVGLASAEYWDANYATQEQALLDAQTAETYYKGEVDAPAITMQRTAAARNLVAPPGGRLDGSFWSAARKVGVSDLAGAVRGGIKGWAGGLQGIAVGAAIEGGAASAGTLISIVLQ